LFNFSEQVFAFAATPHRFSQEAKALTEKFKSLLKETEADGWTSLGTHKDVQVSTKPVRNQEKKWILFAACLLLLLLLLLLFLLNIIEDVVENMFLDYGLLLLSAC